MREKQVTIVDSRAWRYSVMDKLRLPWYYVSRHSRFRHFNHGDLFIMTSAYEFYSLVFQLFIDMGIFFVKALCNKYERGITETCHKPKSTPCR